MLIPIDDKLIVNPKHILYMVRDEDYKTRIYFRGGNYENTTKTIKEIQRIIENYNVNKR